MQHADGHVVYEFEPACHLGAKLAGVHWWFKSRVHAAELTAGYYNTRERDGYGDLMAVLKKHSARLSFTCVEMRDCEHPPEGRCSPEGAAPPSHHTRLYPWRALYCHHRASQRMIQSHCLEAQNRAMISPGSGLHAGQHPTLLDILACLSATMA